jgi:hypothetical protein
VKSTVLFRPSVRSRTTLTFKAGPPATPSNVLSLLPRISALKPDNVVGILPEKLSIWQTPCMWQDPQLLGSRPAQKCSPKRLGSPDSVDPSSPVCTDIMAILVSGFDRHRISQKSLIEPYNDHTQPYICLPATEREHWSGRELVVIEIATSPSTTKKCHCCSNIALLCLKTFVQSEGAALKHDDTRVLLRLCCFARYSTKKCIGREMRKGVESRNHTKLGEETAHSTASVHLYSEIRNPLFNIALVLVSCQASCVCISTQHRKYTAL